MSASLRTIRRATTSISTDLTLSEGTLYHKLKKITKLQPHGHITGTCCKTSSSTLTSIRRLDQIIFQSTHRDNALDLIQLSISSSSSIFSIIYFLPHLSATLIDKRMHTSWMAMPLTWPQSAPTMSGRLPRYSTTFPFPLVNSIWTFSCKCGHNF